MIPKNLQKCMKQLKTLIKLVETEKKFDSSNYDDIRYFAQKLAKQANNHPILFGLK